MNCGVGRKLPAPQHPATSAPTPPSQPSIRDLSHNPILPCFISSSPIVVFPQSPLLYLFRWPLCSSATVSTSSLFLVDMSTVLVFSFLQKSNPKVNFAGLFSTNAIPCNGLPMNPSIQTLGADGGLKSESTGPLFISDN